MFIALYTLYVFVCFFLIAVVLLQSGKGADLASAFGGGGSQAAIGARGAATALSRLTTYAAVAFMLLSLTLSILKSRDVSVLDSAPAANTPVVPAASTTPVDTPGAGTPVAVPEPSSTMDEAAPAEPGAPAEPMTPAPAVDEAATDSSTEGMSVESTEPAAESEDAADPGPESEVPPEEGDL